MSPLARRYARALFEVAQEKGVVDAIAADIASIDGALADEGLRALVAREDLSGRAVAQLLGKLGEGRHALVGNLLTALESRRRHPVLLELRAAFDHFVREARGELVGVAESARPLDGESEQALAQLAGRLSGRKVDLRFEHEPELIGGVRLRLGNTLYDGSIATRLEELHQRLLDAPLA